VNEDEGRKVLLLVPDLKPFVRLAHERGVDGLGLLGHTRDVMGVVFVLDWTVHTDVLLLCSLLCQEQGVVVG